jgi:hypothetical protein
VRSVLRALLSTALVAGCAPPASPAPAAPLPSSGGVSGDGVAASGPDAARTCGSRALPTGFECVSGPAGPALVLASNAPADLDPCPVATCPSGARCESATQEIGPVSHRLPRCVPTAAAPSGPPSFNPCERYLCPAGYHCTAPADAPYCVPSASGW